MKIILTKEVSRKIKEKLLSSGLLESKGACFAHYVDKNHYEVIDTFISDYKGTSTFTKLLINRRYKRFEKEFYKKHKYDYKNYNYIGDWHSHPLFECVPSNYDICEAKNELDNSNGNFLIQIIVKLDRNELKGKCFLYNSNFVAKEIHLFIEE